MTRILCIIAAALFCAGTAAASPVTIGVDVNVPSAAYGLTNDRHYYSGTLSAAPTDSRYEIALPFLFHEHTYHSSNCCSVNIERVDLQLRRFRNARRVGSYLGLLVRHSSVSGRDYFDHDQTASYHRVGVGAVMGVREEIRPGLFWGVNVHIGQFLSEQDCLANGAVGASFFGPSDNCDNVFMNVELLKLGVRF